MNPALAMWLARSVGAFVNANLAALHGLPPDQVAGVRLTSWYRSREKNAQVGGAPRSQHLLALATDWVVPDRLRFIRAMQAQGLVAVDEGSHVHVQAFPAGSLDPVYRAIGL